MLLLLRVKCLLPTNPEGVLCRLAKPCRMYLALQNKKFPFVTNTRIHLHGRDSLTVKAHFSTNQPLLKFWFCMNHTPLLRSPGENAHRMLTAGWGLRTLLSSSPCSSDSDLQKLVFLLLFRTNRVYVVGLTSDPCCIGGGMQPVRLCSPACCMSYIWRPLLPRVQR